MKEALAIEGGSPVRDSFSDLRQSRHPGAEIQEVVETLRSGWPGTGPRVARFEEDFRSYIGCKHAVALNSCTAGLHLSMIALGVKPGDEVITTPLTFVATVNSIVHVGARPVIRRLRSPDAEHRPCARSPGRSRPAPG